MSKRTLLLADDSVTIQKVVNLTFADEGIDVVTVGDGDSAMEKISQISPDVVLADVHMPGLSGYQICEIVRENPVTKDLPVVLLVGSFEPFDESEAARVGANAYLTKPFQSIRQLVSQVTELMPPAAHAESSVEEHTAVAEEQPAAVEERSSPVETEDAQRDLSPEKVRDTTDIESLYHQSFSELAHGDSETTSSPANYVDAGMDDEMIETTSVGGDRDEPSHTSEPQQDQAFSYSAHDGNAEPERSYAQDAGYKDSTPMAGVGQPDYQDRDRDAEFVSGTSADLDAGQPQPFDSFADSSHEEPAHAPAYDAANTAEFDEFSRTEQIPEFEAPPTAQSPSNDELELLELPPIETGKTIEFNTSQSVDNPAQAREIVNLSPELIDIIVQKVVEKMSERN